MPTDYTHALVFVKCILRPLVYPVHIVYGAIYTYENNVAVMTSETYGPGEYIRQLRESRGLSLREAAKRSGGLVSHTHIAELEKRPGAWDRVTLSTLEGLARAYDIDIQELVALTKKPPRERGALERMGARPVTSTMKVPILGTVSAGRGETTVEPEGELEVPEEVLRRYRSYGLFALRVTGDSMYCEDLPISIPPGAYVVAAADLAAQPGDLVVAWHEPTQTGYLKEWRPKREHQVLRSWNPDVPPILVQPDDEIAVQGVVVNVTFDPRRIRKERKGGRR